MWRTKALREFVEKWGAKNFRTLLSRTIFRPSFFDRKDCSRLHVIRFGHCQDVTNKLNIIPLRHARLFRNVEVQKTQRQNAYRFRFSSVISVPLCFKKSFAEVELGFPVLVGTAERIDAKIIDSEQEIQTLLATIHPNECCAPLRSLSTHEGTERVCRKMRGEKFSNLAFADYLSTHIFRQKLFLFIVLPF